MADLEAIICRDLTITARVFKLSHAFFYARGAMVRTIGEAVQRLGFRTIKNLSQTLPQPTWHTIDSEMAALGLDHAEVGRRMAQKWNLPDYTVAVIQRHHNLEAETAFVRHIAAIHVSDCLINHAKVGIPDEIEVLCQVNPNALAALGIDAQTMAELQEVVSNELPIITATCDELIRC